MSLPAIASRIEVTHLYRSEGDFGPGYLEVDDDGLLRTVTDHRPAAWDDLPVLRLDGWVVPGMPDLHSHAFQRLLTGLGESRGPADDSFWTWREAMYRVAGTVDPEALEAAASWLYVELLEAGYTAVAEFHYLHHQPDGTPYEDPGELSGRIQAAARATGIGLTLLPVLYQTGGFGTPAAEGQRRFLHRDVDDFLKLVASLTARSQPGEVVGAAPHSLRAVPAESLRELVDGLPAGVPLHVHLAEQEAEVAAALAHLGVRPARWLVDHLAVDARWCLVHATHLDAGEVRDLAATGAVAGLCPTTEANLGDGFFPAEDWLAAGGAFGVGSDSQVSASPAEELRVLETGRRLVARRRNRLAGTEGPARHVGRFLWERAAAGGAQAVGQPLGALVPGKRADLVVLDPEHPRLVGHGPYTVLDALVLGGGEGAVRDVLVGGRPVVREGRHFDRERLAAGFRKAARRVGE